MAIFTLASGQRRDRGVTQPREHPLAFAAVVQSVLPECLGQPITRCSADSGNSKVGPKPPAVTLHPLIPLWYCIGPLIDARGDRGSRDWVWTERIEDVIVHLCALRRRNVSQIA